LLALLFALLSPRVKQRQKSYHSTRNVGLQKSRAIVAKLAGLFALDAFAGGFIVQASSLIGFIFDSRQI